MATSSRIKNLLRHRGFLRYAANTSWMMAEQSLRIVASLLVGIWVARYLGPEKFGLLSYVLAFTAIFAGIAKLGLDGILVRELVNHKEGRDTYLGTAFWLKLTGAALVMLVIVAIVPFTSNDSTTNFYIFIIAAGLVFQSFEVVEFYFQSQVLAKIVSICKVIQLALSSIMKIILVVTEAELYWFVFVALIDAFTLGVSYLLSYKLVINTTFYRFFDLGVAKKLMKDSWPLMLSALMVMLYIKIDQVMIKEMLGAYDVGQYSVGIRLVEALFFLPNIVVTSLFPAILNARKSSKVLYEARLLRLFSLLVFLSFPILIVFSVASEFIVSVLFGDAYDLAASVLAVYALALPFVFLGVASSRWFVAEGLQRQLFYRALLAVLINISINYFLIPLYGVDGAAVATVITYIFIALVFDLFSKNTLVLARYKARSLIFWKMF